MSFSFLGGQSIACPLCKEKIKRFTPLLMVSDHNYSGCGVDVANCEECGKGFQISYKVDEVTRVESWDTLTREEREAHELRMRAKRLEQKKKQVAKLQAEIERESSG